MQNCNSCSIAALVCLAAGAVLLRPLPVQAVVVIEEALFDPVGIDTGAEWVEVANTGTESQNLSGWQIYPDGVGYFSFPAGFALVSGQSAVVHLRRGGTASAADLYHTEAKANMGNTAGSAALFSGEPRGKDTIKSFVQWGRSGETWESAAAEAGLWKKGAFVDLAPFAEGNSIARIPGSSGSGVEAWRVSVNPAPGSSSGGPGAAVPSASASLPESHQSAASATSSSVSPLPSPRIIAYAGEDRTALVGAEVAFSGRATGIRGEALSSARFIWNFGDGSVAEGPVARHTFRIPGVYRLGLHVSSGSEAASDYLTVTVAPNQLAITDVLSGADGYVRIANQGSAEVDLGGWMLEDAAGRYFSFSTGTKIAGGSSVAFLNDLTGLQIGAASSSVVFLRFSNGALASEFRVSARAPDSARIPSVSLSPVSKQEVETRVSRETAPVPASPPAEERVSELDTAAISVAAPETPRASRSLPAPAFLLVAAGIGVIGALGFIIAKMFFF